MASHRAAKKATDTQKSVSWPALSLEDPRAGRNEAYAPLYPGDPLYPIAAWAYHAAKKLRDDAPDAPDATTSMLNALAEAWPQKPRNQRPVDERIDLELLARRRNGWTVKQLAEAEDKHPDSIRRRLRNAEDAVAIHTPDARPWIEPLPEVGQDAEPPPLNYWLRVPVAPEVMRKWRDEVRQLDERLHAGLRIDRSPPPGPLTP